MMTQDGPGNHWDAVEARWRECAALAFDDLMATVGLPGARLPSLSAGEARAAFDGALGESVRLTRLDGGAYVPPPAPLLALWLDGIGPQGREAARFEVEARALRAVGVGHLLATSTLATLAAHRVGSGDLLAAFLRGEVPDRRPGPGVPVDGYAIVPPTGTRTVDVALLFPFGGGLATAATEVTLREVAAADAPVAARLRTPGGGLMELRRLGDGFIRPVMSPRKWTPVRRHDFLVAVGRGEAWRDNPLRRGVPTGYPSLSVADCAIPAPATRSPSPAYLRAWAEAARFAGRLAEGVALLGDGAWVSCGEPLLDFGLAGLEGRGGHDRDALLADPGDAEWRVTWRLGGHGGLRSWDRMSTWGMSQDVGEASRFRSFLGRLDLGGLGTVKETGMFEERSPGLRLTDLGALCAAASRHLDSIPGRGPSARHVSPGDVAVDVDAFLPAEAVRG